MDGLSIGVGAGVFGLLVAVFGLLVRTMLQVNERSDDNSDKAVERAEKAAADARAEAFYWRNLYLSEHGITPHEEVGPHAPHDDHYENIDTVCPPPPPPRQPD